VGGRIESAIGDFGAAGVFKNCCFTNSVCIQSFSFYKTKVGVVLSWNLEVKLAAQLLPNCY
jgi:hypothetical protein